MQSDHLKTIQRGAMRGLAFSLFAASALSAQSRVLPEGSVIIVRTATSLQSATAQVGESFGTFVVDTVRVDDYTVIPAGSRIRGTISMVQKATRQQSGVIEVGFNELIMPDGTSYAMNGKLTSTDAAERRQIESDPNARVVLVGGRGGIGAAIAGAGSSSAPSGILAALGSLLSEGRDVSVPAGTHLAVQLMQPVTLRARGTARADASTIYTGADRIRAAQQALAQQNYYRGEINGQLDLATQRAIFDYQVDKGLTATGNLDWRTARSLGIVTTGGVGAGTNPSSYGMVLSTTEAYNLRRDALLLVGRQRQDLSVSGVAQVNARRAYASGDVDLWFALSAFADNAALYEQLVRGSGNTDASALAGRALINAARRVDTAMQQARPSSSVQNQWAAIRRQLSGIDQTYSTSY